MLRKQWNICFEKIGINLIMILIINSLLLISVKVSVNNVL